MAPTAFLAVLLAGSAARPAWAHPGHGLAGWLHHGEVLGLVAVVLAGLLVRRVLTAGATTRRDGR